MAIKTKLYRYKVYVIRAYAAWIGAMFTVGTFFMVSYDKLAAELPFFLVIFPNVFVYMGLVVPVVVVFMAFFGRWDMKKGSFKTEQRLAWGENPEWTELRAEMKELQADVRRLLGYFEAQEL